jgi:non-homologous end joining protein Ku
MNLRDKIIKKEANPTLTNKFTDWKSFQSELSEKIQLNVPLRTTQQLDIETKRIVDLIQEVAGNNTPQIKKKVTGNNYRLEIRKFIEQKRKARRTWQKPRTNENKTILHNLMQQLTREIRKIKN